MSLSIDDLSDENKEKVAAALRLVVQALDTLGDVYSDAAREVEGLTPDRVSL